MKLTLSSFLVLRFIPTILVPQMSFISPCPSMPDIELVPMNNNTHFTNQEIRYSINTLHDELYIIRMCENRERENESFCKTLINARVFANCSFSQLREHGL